MVECNTKESIKNFIPISDRAYLLQIKTAPLATNLIHVYALTCDGFEEEVETFYDKKVDKGRKKIPLEIMA